MAEERKITINYQGKEVTAITSYHGQCGETIYELQRKNCKLVFNSIGDKNVIAITNQQGKPMWLGTYSSDIKIQSVDIVQFKEGYMKRFNGASVLDTIGIRYEIPAFNFFENELISEEIDTEIEPAAAPVAAPVAPAAAPAGEPVAPAEPPAEESEADF